MTASKCCNLSRALWALNFFKSSVTHIVAKGYKLTRTCNLYILIIYNIYYIISINCSFWFFISNINMKIVVYILVLWVAGVFNLLWPCKNLTLLVLIAYKMLQTSTTLLSHVDGLWMCMNSIHEYVNAHSYGKNHRQIMCQYWWSKLILV